MLSKSDGPAEDGIQIQIIPNVKIQIKGNLYNDSKRLNKVFHRMKSAEMWGKINANPFQPYAGST